MKNARASTIVLLLGLTACRQAPPLTEASKAGTAPRTTSTSQVADATPSPSASAAPSSPNAVRSQADCPEGMVFIPGASFTVTSPDVWDPARTPRTEQLQVAPFCIDRTEMPRAKYPVERCGPRERNCDLNAASQGPATCVSPKQAECACAHDTPGVTKRLPTDPEWILAALGTDGRRFPWGKDPYPEGYKVGENFCPEQRNVPVRAMLCPVEANTLDRSPFGVIGMSGNGWEMTATCVAASTKRPSLCVMRGGDLDYGPLEVPGTIAYDLGIHSVSAGVSFRCVMSERLVTSHQRGSLPV